MKLKLSLVSGTEVDDIIVTVDATATVNQLAERLRVEGRATAWAAARWA